MRFQGGLSVFTFLRIRTWMNITDKAAAQSVIRDCVHLARMEGLEGHARAAECRLVDNSDATSSDVSNVNGVDESKGEQEGTTPKRASKRAKKV